MLLQLIGFGNDPILLVAQSSLLFSQSFQRLDAFVHDVNQALAILVGNNSLEITIQLLEMRCLAVSQLLFKRFLPALPATSRRPSKRPRPLRKPG